MKIEIHNNFYELDELDKEDLEDAKSYLEFKIDFIKEQLRCFAENDKLWANKAIGALFHSKQQLKAVKEKLCQC